MATIKSFTDIPQSKKLAMILPLESADCFWDYDDLQKYHRISWFEDGYNKDSQLRLNRNNVCAWSLAALLEIIKEQGLVDLRFLQSTFDNRGDHRTNVWCCTFDDIGTVTLDLYADNPVDACVAMIEKLHKLKMLRLWKTRIST